MGVARPDRPAARGPAGRAGPGVTGVRNYLAVRGGIARRPGAGQPVDRPAVRSGSGAAASRPASCRSATPGRRCPTSTSLPPHDPRKMLTLYARAAPGLVHRAGLDRRCCQPSWTVTRRRQPGRGPARRATGWTRRVTDELPSEGLVRGAIQVPASGQPLIFLADHPVTGGYPVIAVLTDRAADHAAQLRPGDVRFDLGSERARSTTLDVTRSASTGRPHQVRITQGAGRQPGRDRGPGDPGRGRRRAAAAWPSTPTRTRTRCSSGWPTRRTRWAAPPRPRPTWTSPRSSTSPRGAAPTRSIPGYGFLAENAGFAQAVIDAGLIWIGPPPAAIDALGDKVKARHIAQQVGAPLVPGTAGPGGRRRRGGRLRRRARAADRDQGRVRRRRPRTQGGPRRWRRSRSCSSRRPGRRSPPSAAASASSSATWTGPGTWRPSAWPTPTATSWSSPPGTARCSAGTRSWSRRRRRRSCPPTSCDRLYAGVQGDPARGRLRRRRDVRVPGRRRTARSASWR